MNTKPLAMPLWSISAVGAVFLLLLYFGADIIGKGIIINNLTPWGPYLGGGTVIWALIVVLIWVLFVQPTLEFRRMLKGGVSLRRKAKIALRSLEQHKQDNSEMEDLYIDLYNAYARNNLETIEQKIQEYEETGVAADRVKDTIRDYCKMAAIGAVISSSQLLDTLIIMGVQMRMITHLARLYGYKTSPLFVMLCLGWVRISAILYALFAEELEEYVGDKIAGTVTEIVGTDIGLSRLGKRATEFALVWINVYMTGRIFMATHALGRKGATRKHMIGYRKEAALDVMKQVLKSGFEKASNAVSSLIDSQSQESEAKEKVAVS